jgi:hypothetical protein
MKTLIVGAGALGGIIEVFWRRRFCLTRNPECPINRSSPNRRSSRNRHRRQFVYRSSKRSRHSLTILSQEHSD